MRKIENIYQLASLGRQEFIEEAYRNILGREPDKSGRDNLFMHLCRGDDKMSLLIALANSEEGKMYASDLLGLKEELGKARLEALFLIGPVIKFFNFIKYSIKNTHYIRTKLVDVESSIDSIEDKLKTYSNIHQETLRKYKYLYISSDLIIEKMQAALSDEDLNNNKNIIKKRIKHFESVFEKYN